MRKKSHILKTNKLMPCNVVELNKPGYIASLGPAGGYETEGIRKCYETSPNIPPSHITSSRDRTLRDRKSTRSQMPRKEKQKKKNTSSVEFLQENDQLSQEVQGNNATSSNYDSDYTEHNGIVENQLEDTITAMLPASRKLSKYNNKLPCSAALRAHIKSSFLTQKRVSMSTSKNISNMNYVSNAKKNQKLLVEEFKKKFQDHMNKAQEEHVAEVNIEEEESFNSALEELISASPLRSSRSVLRRTVSSVRNKNVPVENEEEQVKKEIDDNEVNNAITGRVGLRVRPFTIGEIEDILDDMFHIPRDAVKEHMESAAAPNPEVDLEIPLSKDTGHPLAFGCGESDELLFSKYTTANSSSPRRKSFSIVTKRDVPRDDLHCNVNKRYSQLHYQEMPHNHEREDTIIHPICRPSITIGNRLLALLTGVYSPPSSKYVVPSVTTAPSTASKSSGRTQKETQQTDATVQQQQSKVSVERKEKLESQEVLRDYFTRKEKEVLLLHEYSILHGSSPTLAEEGITSPRDGVSSPTMRNIIKDLNDRDLEIILEDLTLLTVKELYESYKTVADSNELLEEFILLGAEDKSSIVTYQLSARLRAAVILEGLPESAYGEEEPNLNAVTQQNPHLTHHKEHHREHDLKEAGRTVNNSHNSKNAATAGVKAVLDEIIQHHIFGKEWHRTLELPLSQLLHSPILRQPFDKYLYTQQQQGHQQKKIKDEHQIHTSGNGTLHSSVKDTNLLLELSSSNSVSSTSPANNTAVENLTFKEKMEWLMLYLWSLLLGVCGATSHVHSINTNVNSVPISPSIEPRRNSVEHTSDKLSPSQLKLQSDVTSQTPSESSFGVLREVGSEESKSEQHNICIAGEAIPFEYPVDFDTYIAMVSLHRCNMRHLGCDRTLEDGESNKPNNDTLCSSTISCIKVSADKTQTTSTNKDVEENDKCRNRNIWNENKGKRRSTKESRSALCKKAKFPLLNLGMGCTQGKLSRDAENNNDVDNNTKNPGTNASNKSTRTQGKMSASGARNVVAEHSNRSSTSFERYRILDDLRTVMSTSPIPHISPAQSESSSLSKFDKYRSDNSGKSESVGNISDDQQGMLSATNLTPNLKELDQPSHQGSSETDNISKMNSAFPPRSPCSGYQRLQTTRVMESKTRGQPNRDADTCAMRNNNNNQNIITDNSNIIIGFSHDVCQRCHLPKSPHTSIRSNHSNHAFTDSNRSDTSEVHKEHSSVFEIPMIDNNNNYYNKDLIINSSSLRSDDNISKHPTLNSFSFSTEITSPGYDQGSHSSSIMSVSKKSLTSSNKLPFIIDHVPITHNNSINRPDRDQEDKYTKENTSNRKFLPPRVTPRHSRRSLKSSITSNSSAQQRGQYRNTPMLGSRLVRPLLDMSTASDKLENLCYHPLRELPIQEPQSRDFHAEVMEKCAKMIAKEY